MTLDEFQQLLDHRGAKAPAWPAELRGPAEALLAASPEARALLARAARLEALLGAALVPEAPPLASILERAWSRPQARPSPPAAGWLGLGLGRWHAAAFAACLVCGVLLGAVAGGGGESPESLYALIDGSHAGEIHE